MKARIDSVISFDEHELPDAAHQLILDALTVPNEARKAMFYINKRAAMHMAPYVYLFTRKGDKLTVPRGFGKQLEQGLAQFGVSIEWDWHMIDVPADLSHVNEVTLRPYQEEAAKAMFANEHGVLWMPTGGGKTIVALEMWRRSGQKGIVLVEKKHLAQQWAREAREKFGIEPTMYGGGKADDTGALTIAMLQTLGSRRKDLLADGFFDKFGFVCFDENHHAQAPVMSTVVQSFSARHRYGVSATPDTGSTAFRVVKSVIGSVTHRVTNEELERLGSVVKPEVHVIETKCAVDYSGDYASMSSYLEVDHARNELVGDTIANLRGRFHIVLSKRLKHLDLLRAAVIASRYPPEKIFMLTGKEDAAERTRVRDLAETMDEMCVFSTVGYEALDIPRLDTVHLPWPTKKQHIVQQAMGRASRTHPRKTDARVYDYADLGANPVLTKQFGERMKLYRSRALTVHHAKLRPTQVRREMR